MERIDENSFGIASAIVSAGVMLLLGIFGNIGIYTGAVQAMMDWHMFFSLSVGGVIGGMIEAAVICYIIVYAFAWTYNKLA